MRAGLAPLQELSPGLTPKQLQARLTQVLQFAINNLDGLDRYAPFWQEEETPAQKNQPSLVNQADKVVVESALLALLASRVYKPSDPGSEVLSALAERLISRARNERNQVLLLRFPHTVASLGIAHICLSYMGYRDESYDRLIRDAIASGHVEALERLPYRAMDLRWLIGILDPVSAPDFDDLLPHSILTSKAHPLYMSELDVYAITHGVMYVTDFGSYDLPRALPLHHLGSMIDSCLAWHILSGNFDLLGELLLSAAAVVNPWSSYARVTWQLLVSIWDEFGFLPSCTFDTAHYASLSGDKASAYAFLHTYHTTYVAGLLCAVLLLHPEHGRSSNSEEPAWIADSILTERAKRAVVACQDFCSQNGNGKVSPVNSRSSSDASAHRSALKNSVAQIQTYPGPCGRTGAAWTSLLNKALPWKPDELALVLNDGLIVQAARDYKLPVLISVLLDRAASDLPVSPTVLEALSFLIRQQLPSGAIGAHFVVADNRQSAEAANITQTIGDCITRLIPYVTTGAPQSIVAVAENVR
jgi:hypothetical protein